MKRKYLDEIGAKDRHDLWNKKDKRKEKWKKQRKKYGFDERETWALDSAFYCWLYERLMMYKEVCHVDLSYHTFDYDGKEYSQGELIDMMLVRLRFRLENGDGNPLREERTNYVSEIEKIWAVVLPAMWW